MPRFSFRLQAVLQHRERIESEKQREFAEAERVWRAACAQRDAYCRRREELAAELHEKHRDLDVETLRISYAHLEFLAREITKADRTVALRLDEMEACRMVLIDAARDVKVLETLRTRKRAEYDAEELQSEQRELDDGNARRYGRALTAGKVAP